MVMSGKKFESDMEKRFEKARNRLSELEKLTDNPEMKQEIKQEIRELRRREEEFRAEFRKREREVGNIWQMMDDLIAGSVNEFMNSVEKLSEQVSKSEK